MTDRIEAIEVRIAFLEQANAQLSDTIIAQQHEIAALRQQLAALLQRLEAVQEQPTDYTPEDEKPPHY